ncbi:MAG: hypothetical protein V1647_04430 [Pseudomonadota bacterium]
MKKKGLIFVSVLFVFVAVLVFAFCGGSSSGVSSLDDLPKMTSPVVSGSAASVRVSAATTGVPFWGTSQTSFTAGMSRSMCESFNVTREILNRAAQSDKVLCYIQNTIASSANEAAMSGLSAYDGNYHIVQLDFASSPNPNSQVTLPKMKMKIVKDGSNITEFEMFMCMSGTNAALQQSEYMHMVIDGSNNITITSKNIETGSQSWKNHMLVTGAIDSSGQFTSKNMTGVTYSSGTWGGGTSTNYAKAVFDQYADYLTATAYQTGTNTFNSNTNQYSTQVYGKFQLINGTSTDLHTWAMGDGSINVSMSNVWQGQTYTHQDVYSWLGDTKMDTTASAGMYYADAAAGTVPTTSPTTEASAIAFGTSETWDCSGTAENTTAISVDQTALSATCDVYGFSTDGDTWIDCYNAIGN